MKKTYLSASNALELAGQLNAFYPARSAQPLGLSKVTISQTVNTAATVDNPTKLNGRLAFPTNQLTIKPHCVTLSRVLIAPFTAIGDNSGRNFDQFVVVRTPDFKPRGNGFKRFLLPATARKIKESVALMLQGSKMKKGGGGGWRVSMLTLTLCALQAHDDKTLNAQALNQLFVVLRRWRVENYVWVTERQDNGSIHWHIILDRFIDKDKVRRSWNSILFKLGYLQRYTSKHVKMSFSDYWNEYGHTFRTSNGESQYIKAQKAFARGVACGWTNPNSTDVKAARNIDRVMSYVSKYMVKGVNPVEMDDDGRYSVKWLRPSGRRFGRSLSITALAKIKTYRRGAWSVLNGLLERVITDLGDAAKVFENDDFKGVFFEPLTSPMVNKLLQPALIAANYRGG